MTHKVLKDFKISIIGEDARHHIHILKEGDSSELFGSFINKRIMDRTGKKVIREQDVINTRLNYDTVKALHIKGYIVEEESKKPKAAADLREKKAD